MGRAFVSIQPVLRESTRSSVALRPWRLAFVVPRYGAEIVGGAETLARAFAENLPVERFEVEILTTCALDHHRWQNVLPAGEVRLGRTRVRRFPVSARDVERFLRVQERIAAGIPVPVGEELDWAAGSVNSEDLYSFLAANAASYDALIFLPYLFGTTLLGAHVAPDRSLLIPCLHDEGFAYTATVRHLFRSVRGTIFNSAPERALAGRLYDVVADAPVVGMGFAASAPANASEFRKRHGIDGDYLLYFGRKEEGKNLPLLLDAFAACDRSRGLALVLAGDGSVGRDAPAGLVDLPRLDEHEKRAACAGALAVCQPSTNESFSIVLMESWLEGTPVLVHGRCDVTRAHVSEAGGGLYFETATEFAAEVDYLRTHVDVAEEMGRLGREYVRRSYSWERVTERFEAALRRWVGEP
ncbi:MAG: hypothetical protein QOD06_499 [Candidatus Binatota bacterium]|jgi:glycosyltransferase involved in cell wall biosynthesis|nr:hypothetical protein [Candidatus Binatota bacterium]